MPYDREETGNPGELKKTIRQRILKIRDAISSTDRARYDSLIMRNVLHTAAYRQAGVIFAYAGYRSEVDTQALIGHALMDGKYVFAPKVSGNEMEFWRITAMEDLREGYRGIPEPAESISFPKWLTKQIAGEDNIFHAMMWMPGAVFDRERHRIGYGKGFYDRYLSSITERAQKIGGGYRVELHLTTAALAYGCQVLERIPCEPHDIRPDVVVTEEEILSR